MRFRKAIDAIEGERRIHAVAVGDPGKTICRVKTTGLLVNDEDWEVGSHRPRCADCVDLVASRYTRSPLAG